VVGQPNRQLVNYYRATMAASGLPTITHSMAGAAQRLPTSTTSLRGVDYSTYRGLIKPSGRACLATGRSRRKISPLRAFSSGSEA
jgi:hypothetical protein